jgi:hypothetical protein
MPFSDDVQRGLVAGAFGLVGTLVPAVISWSHDRDAASARLRKLDEATKKVAFWEQWLKLSTQICGPDDGDCIARVRKELALLAELLENDSTLAQADMVKQRGRSTEFQEKVHAMSTWRRLLLLYKPARALAWVPRLFFFMGFFLAALMLFTLLDSTHEFSYKDLAIVEVMLFIWMAIFRSLSQWLEQPHGPPSLIGAASTAAPPPPKI